MQLKKCDYINHWPSLNLVMFEYSTINWWCHIEMFIRAISAQDISIWFCFWLDFDVRSRLAIYFSLLGGLKLSVAPFVKFDQHCLWMIWKLLAGTYRVRTLLWFNHCFVRVHPSSKKTKPLLSYNKVIPFVVLKIQIINYWIKYILFYVYIHREKLIIH